MNGVMKYSFFKLSIFSLTLYLLAMSVNTALADRIIILSADGSFTEEAKTSDEAKTYQLRDSPGTVALTNNESRYSNLKVEKKTYYPDSSIPALSTTYSFQPRTFYYINCRKKEFDNTKICYLKAGDIYVFLINGRYSVDVGSNHYPRSKAGLRIDNNPAVYGYEGEFSKPLSIIEKLKKGKFAYTRYQEWPYLSDIDKKTDLKDFTKQFNEMLKQYKNL